GWPTERPIRLIVPFQAGSSSDTIARIVSQKLSDRLGQQIVIDNRVGASSMIGTEAVARSQPDGYTLGLANTTTHASATALSASPTYDPVKDFAPVAMVGSSPFVLLGAPKFPASDVAALIVLAKEKPATISYASAGPGTMDGAGAASGSACCDRRAAQSRNRRRAQSARNTRGARQAGRRDRDRDAGSAGAPHSDRRRQMARGDRRRRPQRTLRGIYQRN